MAVSVNRRLEQIKFPDSTLVPGIPINHFVKKHFLVVGMDVVGGAVATVATLVAVEEAAVPGIKTKYRLF